MPLELAGISSLLITLRLAADAIGLEDRRFEAAGPGLETRLRLPAASFSAFFGWTVFGGLGSALAAFGVDASSLFFLGRPTAFGGAVPGTTGLVFAPAGVAGAGAIVCLRDGLPAGSGRALLGCVAGPTSASSTSEFSSSGTVGALAVSVGAFFLGRPTAFGGAVSGTVIFVFAPAGVDGLGAIVCLREGLADGSGSARPRLRRRLRSGAAR